jgi:hypothetical protein
LIQALLKDFLVIAKKLQSRLVWHIFTFTYIVATSGIYSLAMFNKSIEFVVLFLCKFLHPLSCAIQKNILVYSTNYLMDFCRILCVERIS